MNGAAKYSPACRNVKYIPSPTVMDRAWMALVRSPSIRLWWAHVTVTAVFRRGTLNGFSGVIPMGGQQHPSSGVGARLL